MRYFLKAMGSHCYDETGITFPEREEIDLAQLLKEHGAKNIRWANQFGWSNQPKVLTFNLEGTTDEPGNIGDYLRQIKLGEAMPYGLGVYVHWDRVPRYRSEVS